MTKPRSSWRAVVVAAAASAPVLAAAGAAQATVVFPPTDALSPYSIVSVGPKASIKINSGPIDGKVLAGDGAVVATSGGNNGSILGGAYADTQAQLNNFNGLQVKPTETLVSSTLTTSAFNEAAALQSFLDGLAVDQTLGALSGAVSVNASNAGGDGVKVIQFTSLQNATLTLSGTGNDIIVLRTSGNVNTNHVMTLTGGLKASHVIWDLDGTMGNVLQTSGGDAVVGTFIDTKGGNFQFSELGLDGQLINTGGHIEFVSGSTMRTSVFTPTTPAPEPAAWALMLLGFFGLGGLARVRRGNPA